MADQINYKKASAYYLFGNLFNKGFSFLTVPIFTRILSTADYGVVTTYNAWVSILTIVLSCAIYMGIRLAFVDYKDQVDEFLSVCCFFNVLVTAIATVLILGAVWLLGIEIDIRILLACILQSFAAGILLNYTQFQMMKYAYKSRTMLLVLPPLVSIVSSIFLISLMDAQKYMGRILPTSGVHLIFALGVLCVVFSRGKTLINKEYLRFALKISAPLIVHGIALSILSQSDRMMITWLADSSQTGIYSLVYNFSTIAVVLTTTIEGVWVPWFLRKMGESKQEEINHLAKDYIFFMGSLMVCIIMVGPEIIKLLAAEAYWEGISIVPPIIFANYIVFMYTMYVNIEHYHKKSAYITLNTLIAALINIVLNLLLIPHFGYVAAAYTTLAAYLISFLLHSRYAKKLEPQLYPLGYFRKSLIHMLLAVVLYYPLRDYGLLRWGLTLCYAVFVLLTNLQRIREMLPAIRKK